MPVVIDKVLRSRWALTLVAPHWTAQPWYWRAVERCTRKLRIPPMGGRSFLSSRHSSAPKPAWGVDVFRFEARPPLPPPRCALSA